MDLHLEVLEGVATAAAEAREAAAAGLAEAAFAAETAAELFQGDAASADREDARSDANTSLDSSTAGQPCIQNYLKSLKIDFSTLKQQL